MKGIHKKLLLILILTLLGLFNKKPVYSQGNHCFGIKAGINVSNLYAGELNNENLRLGLNAGLYGQPLSSRRFALQTELLFSTKGSLVAYKDLKQEVNFNLSYLDIPIFGVLKLDKISEIHIGAYTSYLIASSITYRLVGTSNAERINGSDLNSFDYGLVAGAGISIGVMQVGVRYNYGLAAIAKSTAAKTFMGDAKNSWAQLFLAFNFGKR